MHGLRQNLAPGLRTMVRRPGFAATIVLALGVGIGANTAMFSILNAVLLRPLPFPEPQRLVFGYTIFPGDSGLGLVSAPDYFDCRDSAEAFESLAAMLGFESQSTVTGGERPERVNSTVISVDLLPTLGVTPVLGRGFLPDEAEPGAPPVVLVSHAFWQRRLGGSPGAVGTTLGINGSLFTVVGVLPTGFRIQSDNDIWMPMVDDPASHLPRRMHNWHMVGRLKSGVTLEEARAQVEAIAQRLQLAHPGSNRDKTLGLMSLHDALVREDRASLLVLMGAVALVLLIACANVAGLLFARGCTRRQELAMRTALGASRVRLARQLLTESAALTAVATAFGLLLATSLRTALLRVVPLESLGVAEVPFDTRVLLFALSVSAATALLFGLAPAWRNGRTDPAVDLRAGARATDGRGGARLRSVLIAGQVALSAVLLVSAGLLFRSLTRLHDVDLGFRADSLITAEIELPPSRYRDGNRRAAFASTLLERIRALPAVESAGLISLLPVREARNNTEVWAADEPRPEDAPSYAFIRSVLPGYFESMGIPLLAGRDIRGSDRDGTTEVIVVNQSLVRSLFPDRNPLGRQVVIDYPGAAVARAEVVGVVGDVRVSGPAFPPAPVLYASYLQRQTETEMHLAARVSGEPAAAIGALRALVRELDPEVPVADVASMERFVNRWLSDHETVATLVSAFAAAAVLLAGLGLYPMLSFYVGQRTREIGVRMALGAATREVLAMVLGRGLSLVLIGLVLGLAGSWAASRFLGHLLQDVAPTDPLTLAASTLAFLAVGLLACFPPAWRASRIDPTISLNSE